MRSRHNEGGWKYDSLDECFRDKWGFEIPLDTLVRFVLDQGDDPAIIRQWRQAVGYCHDFMREAAGDVCSQSDRAI